MGATDGLEQLRAIATRICATYGLVVYDVQKRRESGRWVARVLIDRPGPAATAEESVSIEDCTRVSRDLSALVDVEDVFEHAYTLEVSSPGLDRPLRTADEFRRFAGRLAQVVTREPVDGMTFLKGRLRGVEDDRVIVEGDRQRVHRIPIGVISRARLEVEF
jgi:ribosome maturation factor RimP